MQSSSCVYIIHINTCGKATLYHHSLENVLEIIVREINAAIDSILEEAPYSILHILCGKLSKFVPATCLAHDRKMVILNIYIIKDIFEAKIFGPY